MENIETKIVVGGDTTGAQQAIQDTIDSLETLRSDMAKPISQIGAFEQATAGLDKLQGQLDETRRKLAYFREQAKLGGDVGAKAFAADIRAAEREIDRLNTGIGREKSTIKALSSDLAKAGVNTRDLANEKSRLAGAVLKAETGIINLKGKLLEEQAAARQAAVNTRQVGDAAAHVDEQGKKGAAGVGKMAGAMRALATAVAVKEFVSANAALESTQAGMEAITGSSAAAGRELEFVRSEAGRLGIDITSAAGSYLNLAASAKGTVLEGQATREIWSSVAAAMAKLGKSSADTDGALLAVSQMMSKGTVSAEELRGQLGERLPGAFQIAAQAMGVTTAELGKMLQNGEILASDFLPKFAAELRRAGGDGGEINTFNSNVNRLWSSLKTGAVTVGDVTGVFSALGWAINKVAASIDATSGFLGLFKANITGNAEEASKFANRLQEVRNRLLGIYDTSDKAEEMSRKFDAAATNIEASIREKIIGALLKVDSAISTTDASLRTLGMDPEQIRTGVTTAERAIVESAKRVMADRDVADTYKLEALLRALDKVGSAALPELGFAWKATMKQAGTENGILEAGLNAIKTKSDGLWQDMGKGAKEAGKEVANMGNLLKQAADLRSRANKKPVDDSPDAQAFANLALTEGRMELSRLNSPGTPIEDIRAQAEKVRQLADAVTDAAAAQKAKAYADDLEASALERLAKAGKASATTREKDQTTGKPAAGQGASEQANQDIARVSEALAKLPDRKTIEVRIVATSEVAQDVVNGAVQNVFNQIQQSIQQQIQSAVADMLSRERLKRGYR